MKHKEKDHSSLKKDSSDNGDFEDGHRQASKSRKRKIGDPFDNYVEEVSRIQLLNANAEHELGCLIWHCREILAVSEQYGLDASEDIENLLREAREIMVTSNLRLVISIASKYRDSHLRLLDFIQLGNTGLMKAADGFDYRRGTRFSTYATPKIKQPILSAFPRSKEIKIPSYIDQLKRRIERFSQEFEETNKKFPSCEEIADELGCPMESVMECLEIKDWFFFSIERGPSDSGEDGKDRQFVNVLEDKGTLSPEDSAYESHRRNAIDDILAGIPQPESETLKGRFGFRDKEESLEEIGQKMKVTREWVRQLEKSGLTRARQPHRAKKIQQFHDEL